MSFFLLLSFLSFNREQSPLSEEGILIHVCGPFTCDLHFGFSSLKAGKKTTQTTAAASCELRAAELSRKRNPRERERERER